MSESSSGATVLVVEDDGAVRELIAFHLRRGGFDVLEAATAGEGWPYLERVDAVVLDRMLPDESGDSFLRRLRSHDRFGGLPVLMLTARSSEVDRVGGLESGADDYVTKPFSSAELVARLRALLRRLPSKRRYRLGKLLVDVDAGLVRRESEEVELTRREFELLAFLAANQGRVFTRSELLDRVWGAEFVGSERTVDQHVAQLRSRLGDSLIETVRGRGYRIADDHSDG